MNIKILSNTFLSVIQKDKKFTILSFIKYNNSPDVLFAVGTYGEVKMGDQLIQFPYEINGILQKELFSPIQEELYKVERGNYQYNLIFVLEDEEGYLFKSESGHIKIPKDEVTFIHSVRLQK